ncbi:hypothetical protein SAURM35S_04702 [Streptomyces aurantiogriseus]
MTSTVPNAVEHADEQQPPITMFGPDFPYAYDDFLAHPAGLGQIPATEHGTEVAVIGGGLSGIVAAYELMKMGLKPVVYEADRIGGRLRTVGFEGCDPSLTAEMGAMRFPPSSTALQHYIDLVGLETRPFPNPLAEATPSTVVDLKGESHYAETIDDLPQVYRDVAAAWNKCLEEGADFSDMNRAMRERDVPRIREIWAKLVEKLDNQTFYGFLCDSEAFRSFRHREIFGQVGFGTGGWDTDFPNSILEILRVVYTEADDHHRGIVGGSQQLPLRLWEREPEKIVHWSYGTSLASLHENGEPRPAVTRLHRTAGNRITVTDAGGDIRTYKAAVFTAQSWMLLSKIDCDDSLFGRSTTGPREYAPEAITSQVSEVTSGAAAEGRVPVLVPYAIPDRDCGGASEGGAPDLDAYAGWIDRFAAGLGHGEVVVILEPDSIAQTDCLSEEQRADRLAVLAHAGRVLKAANPRTRIYYDAGHSGWHAPARQAALLKQAGAASAASAGIFSNVSNFRWTADEIAYDRQVLDALGGPADLGAVIDTSRNGNGPPADGQWCDPDGRRIGRAPTLDTGEARIHAYLWVKLPGESDGCKGAPGTFSPSYAYELAR